MRLKVFLSAAALAGASTFASAATVPYLPQGGTTIDYVTIAETSPDPTPLFNQPFSSGDSLLFDYPDFFAVAEGPAGYANDNTNGQVDLTIQAKPGHTIQSVSVHEFGGYLLKQAALNAGAAYAEVDNSSFFARVVEVAGVPVPITMVTGTMSFPDGDKFYMNVPSYADSPLEGDWTATGTINVAALYGSNQITKITFSFNNILTAEKTNGAYASIFKNGVTISTVTAPIPEPATLALIGGAVSMLLIRRRQI